MSFNKIGLALSFSPSMHNNLAVALHIKRLYGAELCIIHSTSADNKDKAELEKILIDSKCDLNTIKIIEGKDDPADFILKTVTSEKIDLLIAGALKKENFVKHYIGSVARRLMHEAKCSVLIVSMEQKFNKKFNKFCTLVNYTNECERAIKTAYEFANIEKAENFCLIRDLWVPGLSLSGLDSGSIKESTNAINNFIEEEKEKIKIYIDEMQLTGKVPIQISCFYEKVAFNLSNYIKEIKADLLVISSPPKKTTIFDRFVADEFRYFYDDLPSNLLIIR
ncbi:MAG TPA: universal stress protein [Melioribacteraceae bacterium]|nr:universal stress protein [Melioribacteraceae bacterium]